MVFFLCFLLLRLLLCCSCVVISLSLKCKNSNILIATFGSPALPGRQPHCANRLAPVSFAEPPEAAFRACRLGSDGNGKINFCK